MASYLPPTETLPIFDNTVFDSNNTTALTYATAKNLFITYPSAQGTSTITDFIAGTINYLSPLSGSFFNIGTNQVSGGTIRIGPTGASTGVSVHVSNIDFKNNTINNATSATTGNILLGDSQTSGILNIGTGARVLSGSGGAINIGTGSGAIVNPINIGGGSSSTNVGNTLEVTGMLTANGGITLPSGDTLTLTGNLTGAGNITTTGTGTITSAGLITATSGITMGSNQTIFQTSGQQLRLGYANTQSSGGASSSFGPFIKSFGPDTVTGTTYSILYDGTNGIVPTNSDGVGGLLTVVLKSGTSTKTMTVLYAMSKRVGMTGFTSLGTAVSSNATGWTTTPVFSAGTGNNITITFNASDWSGATVSWIFMGAV